MISVPPLGRNVLARASEKEKKKESLMCLLVGSSICHSSYILSAISQGVSLDRQYICITRLSLVEVLVL